MKSDWGPILLHELAHFLGLAHVDDPGQVMHPAGGEVKTYDPGDLAALHRVGAAVGSL